MVMQFPLPLPGPLAAGGDFMVMLIVGVIWVVIQMINKRASPSSPPTTQEPAPDLDESQPAGDLAEFLEKLKGDLPKTAPTTHRPPPAPVTNPTAFHKPQNPNFSHAQRSTGPAIPVPIEIPAPSPNAPIRSRPRPTIDPLPDFSPHAPELLADFSNRKALIQFMLAREILGQPLALRRPETESR